MRIAILSDIHANVVALQTVLLTVKIMQVEQIWCLGDVVGYGPEPQACADIIRANAEICLAGNHDLAVIGKLSLSKFNPLAARAIDWQRRQLRAETRDWLASLPSKLVLPQITLAHGSPRAPVWEYVADDMTADESFTAFDTPLCLVGHSHLAVGWRLPQHESGAHSELV
ncbi:MAG: metallophosphoesterase, partial [Chloroflexi bacterium]|nr:metallophosphoesterase [Chloroflexota bacterium]